jgi:hypothetical protein
MQKVTGIGGFFFRAKDPEALSKWYADNLGIDIPASDYEGIPWRQQSGTTVFAPFPCSTDYFGDDQQQWMINFRVKDLAAIIVQLQNNGQKVSLDKEVYPNGRFARLHDLEGNPIELWEPNG